MRNLGATSTGNSKRQLLPERVHGTPAHWHETLAAGVVVLVGLAAFAFMLIVLPSVISI
jgi:hypothetical protein